MILKGRKWLLHTGQQWSRHLKTAFFVFSWTIFVRWSETCDRGKYAQKLMTGENASS